jgi:NDP-sugar pyrophosphorylase family protein
MILQIAILAGGLATRLKPVSQKIPKSMIEISGKPFIAHQLELLKRNGIKDIVICAGYLGEQIRDYVKDGSDFGVNVKYSFDGDRLLGTGGAIRKALYLLPENFFVIYGDSYLDVNFKEISDFFFKNNAKALMTVLKNDGRWDKSNVIYRDGRIIKYDKKNIVPEMDYIDYGLGILSRDVFNDIEENIVIDLADIYKSLAREKRLFGYEVKERFYEVGSFRGIEETREYLKKGN